LTSTERDELLTLIGAGESSARKVKRANILLLSDEGKKDEEIAEALHTSVSTIERTRKRCVMEGLTASLKERPRPGARCKLDAKGEAVLETLAKSKPPDGRKRWTMQLLADRLVELKVVDTISDETVRIQLKKAFKAQDREEMVYSNGRSRIRLADGRCPGFVCRARRSQTPTCLFRRNALSDGGRKTSTFANGIRQTLAIRLRIPTHGNLQYLSVLQPVCWLATYESH